MFPTSRWSFVLRLLAPYIGVAVGLYGFHSAWAGILIYHALMLFWSWRHVGKLAQGWSVPGLLLIVLPSLAAGPVVYFLLPIVVRSPEALDAWLAQNGLGGLSFALMVHYFALVNPLLEEAHWNRVRGVDGRGWAAHAAFAAYHALVLWPMIRPPWIAATVATLFVASVIWGRAAVHTRGLAIPALSHLVADAAIMVAVCLLQFAG
jgi:hypothetical protein